MCTDNVKEKTELLYALINGRKLSDLPKISQQTLIIWGEQDQVFPLELGLWLKRHLGDTSELVIVKNAGHAINREKPAELCRLIRNYIIDPTVKYRDDRKVHNYIIIVPFLLYWSSTRWNPWSSIGKSCTCLNSRSPRVTFVFYFTDISEKNASCVHRDLGRM